jgi:hypothetical protein
LDFKETERRLLAEFILLRIGTFGFHSNQGISLLAEELLASREGF